MDANTSRIEQLERELQAAREEARQARAEARTDDMTGLGNKRLWREKVEEMQARGEGFAVLLFDLANLKAANTILGHAGADNLLREVASCIRGETDIAARLGGDEFGVLLPGATRAQADLVRERIEAKVGTRVIAPSAAVFIAGAAAMWEPGADLHERMKAADFRLERRKAARKIAMGMPTDRDDTIRALAS